MAYSLLQQITLILRTLKKMKHFLLYIAVGGILFTALDSTFTQMTIADCNAGVQLACDELKK